MGLIQFDYPQLRWPPQVEPWSPVLPSYSPLIFTVPKSYEGVDLQVMRDRHSECFPGLEPPSKQTQ
jgi:hypothetical protein